MQIRDKVPGQAFVPYDFYPFSASTFQFTQILKRTHGFDTNNYTPISYEGNVTLYAQNYGYGKDDNYDIKLFISNGNAYTQVGKLYGEGDKLQVEVFSGHSINLVWQRHQMENQYYAVQLNGPIAKTYEKDFKGEDTGYTSGNVYVKYNGAASSVTAPPANTPPVTTPPAQSGNDVKVVLNGNAVAFDQPPIIESGRTLVPIRAIFEALGATVSWDQATQTATAVGRDITIKITIGSGVMYKNDTQVGLDVPARIVGNRTLVPVRAISESFGSQVDWDNDTRTVIIKDQNANTNTNTNTNTNNATAEKWIDAKGTTAEPKNSRDVRNDTNGFGTNNYTPISYEGNVTLYAQNYGYGNDDNYDIKLFILNGNEYTQVGKLYGEGDKLQVEVFNGHSITLTWQRHQIENQYYVVQLSGPIAKTYEKDFNGEDTGYTSGNVYVKYGV